MLRYFTFLLMLLQINGGGVKTSVEQNKNVGSQPRTRIKGRNNVSSISTIITTSGESLIAHMEKKMTQYHIKVSILNIMINTSQSIKAYNKKIKLHTGTIIYIKKRELLPQL